MQPTLNPGNGDGNDLVLAEKWSTKLYRYRRGDVVLLRWQFLLRSTALCGVVWACCMLTLADGT